MKLFAGLFVLLSPFVSNALTVEATPQTEALVPTYVYECERVAQEAFNRKAKSMGLEVDVETVVLSGFELTTLRYTAAMVWSMKQSSGQAVPFKVTTYKMGSGACIAQDDL